jgi:hypothetical protein
VRDPEIGQRPARDRREQGERVRQQDGPAQSYNVGIANPLGGLV